ncbi:MAG: alpha/beta hydrolase [Verrucomicrobia bacterium]|nr:alpha/beta hydrolase [Verrucomicrobiota bacterium]
MPDRAAMETQFHALPDGRKVCFAEYGDPAGRPLYYFHGWPSSRLQGRLLHKIGQEQGLRIIAPDRPGIGQSSPQPNRRLADWPALLGSLADALGHERFLVMGVSGGGPYALAAAHWLPERVEAASVVGGAPPLREFPDKSALLFPYRVLLKLRPIAPLVMTPLLPISRFIASQHPTDAPLRWCFRWVSPMDREAINKHDDLQIIMGSFREGIIQGGRHLIRDADIYSSDWEIDFEKISVPVDIWHGTEDRNLPLSMVRQIATRIPTAHTHWVEEGHYSLPINRTPDLIHSLLALAPR